MNERPRGRELWPGETPRPDEDCWDDETDEDGASSLLDVALALAASGLPVFPCNADKRPAIPKAKGGNGFHDASVDPDRIRELWELAGPAAQLIGVPTGATSGLDVLDVDPRHGGDVWEAENSDRLGETRMHGTLSGGRHYLYRHVDGVRNGASDIAPGVDVRGSGGYVCFPPSPGYSVIHESDIAGWPEWLLPLVLKAADPAARPAYPAADPSRVTDRRIDGLLTKLLGNISAAPKGAVHDTLLAIAHTLGGYAHLLPYSESELLGLLLNALPPDDNPDPVNEKKTAMDGLQRGMRSPLQLEERPYRGNSPGAPPPDPEPQPDEPEMPPPDPEPGPEPDDDPLRELDVDDPLAGAVLPDLFVMKADLPLVSQRLRDRLARHQWLFERGGPARLTCCPPEENRPAEIHLLGVEGTIHAAHEVCRPYQVDGRGKRNNVTLPDRVAKLYLALNGRWNLRPLHGICGSVLLEDDGSIHAHEGYHARSGMWCAQAPPLNVPDRPAKDEAVDALYRLRAAMRTFTFKGSLLTRIEGIDADVVDIEQKPGLCESAALCGLLTAVCRASLPLAPGVMINAPSVSGSGAGKGLLARMIVAIAFGIIAKAGTAGHDEQELEKRIGASLLRGEPVLLLDNLNNMLLRSAQLESCLTEPLVSVRLFGVLKMQDVRCTAFVVVTGNGLQASGDTARRFVYPTLEPPVDNPEQREYPAGFLDSILARRDELLSDCLTIWRYGRQQSRLPRGLPFGSYERWTTWVRDPLLALGCADPVEGVQEARKRDPARVNLTALFAEWRVWHGSDWMKADDLNPAVRRLIDDRERTAAIRQKLSPLVNTRLGGFMLEGKIEGNAATAVSLYRVIEIGNG